MVAHFLTSDERISVAKLGGVGLGIVGVEVMVGKSLVTNSDHEGLAEIACLIASLSYALAAVWARQFKTMGVSPLGVTAGQLTAGAILIMPLAVGIDRPWSHPLPPLGVFAAIAALALACTAFAYVLYFRLIETSGATNALLVTLVVPPIAVLFGAIFLRETFEAKDFAGLALIAAGLVAIDGRLFSMIPFLPRRGASPPPGSSSPGHRHSARLLYRWRQTGSRLGELLRQVRPKAPSWGPDSL